MEELVDWGNSLETTGHDNMMERGITVTWLSDNSCKTRAGGSGCL